jgi:hypothetical protein
VNIQGPIAVASPSMAWVCGCSLAGLRVGCLSHVRVVCCQVEVSATDRSLVQRSPTDRPRDCVCVCVGGGMVLSAIICNSKPLHLQRVGRRGQTKNERKNNFQGLCLC